jgi:hypothetical protein
LPNSPLRRTRWIEEWRPPYRHGNSQIRRFPYRGSRFAYRQNLTARRIAIIIFHAKANRLKDLLPLVLAYLARIASIQPGQIVTIDG